MIYPESNSILRFTRGSTVEISMDTPWNLTGYTATSDIRGNSGQGSVFASFTTSFTINPTTSLLGRILLTLPATVSVNADVGVKYVFDVKLSNNGYVQYIPGIWLEFESMVTA